MQDVFVSRLHKFANAMVDGDMWLATEWCDLPLTILRPTGSVVFQTREAIADDLAKSWNPYAEDGVAAVSPHVLEYRCYSTSLGIADVEWRFFDKDGQIRNSIFSSYAIRQTDGDFRVSVIMAHNEIRERPHTDVS